MSRDVVHLYVRDAPNCITLLRAISAGLGKFMNRGIRFHIHKISTPEQIKTLKDAGITTLPVIMWRGARISGTPAILAALNRGPAAAQKRPKQELTMESYINRELQESPEDEEYGEDLKTDVIQKRISSMMDKRPVPKAVEPQNKLRPSAKKGKGKRSESPPPLPEDADEGLFNTEEKYGEDIDDGEFDIQTLMASYVKK
jgi:hypothetical protein